MLEVEIYARDWPRECVQAKVSRVLARGEKYRVKYAYLDAPHHTPPRERITFLYIGMKASLNINMYRCMSFNSKYIVVGATWSSAPYGQGKLCTTRVDNKQAFPHNASLGFSPFLVAMLSQPDEQPFGIPLSLPRQTSFGASLAKNKFNSRAGQNLKLSPLNRTHSFQRDGN
jgi:hypothetical protein